MTFVAGTNLAWRSRGEWKEGALYESCVQKAQCCLCVIGERFQRLLPCASQQGVSCLSVLANHHMLHGLMGHTAPVSRSRVAHKSSFSDKVQTSPL